MSAYNSKAVRLSDRGIALGDFAFRDGQAIGLSPSEAWSIGKRLIEQWDGSESLLEIYNRTERWPDLVGHGGAAR